MSEREYNCITLDLIFNKRSLMKTGRFFLTRFFGHKNAIIEISSIH